MEVSPSAFHCNELLTNICRQFFLNQLWSLINGMSILVLSSLISIQLSGIGQTIMQGLLQFIQFDMLVTQSWLVPWICSLDDQTEAESYPEGISSSFFNNGIVYVSVLKNLQSTLVYLFILATLLGLYSLLKVSGETRLQRYLVSKLSSHLIWSGTIRFFI